MDHTKLCEFVNKLDKALSDFKKGIPDPISENITLMFSPEEIETLKTVFDDAIQLNISYRNRDRLRPQHKLYENVFLQVGSELMR
jgi:hypothetical protein